MPTAVYIEKLDADHNPDGGTISFEQYEIADVTQQPFQQSVLKRAQNGKPTMFLLSDYYQIIALAIRIYGENTQGKLATIRNHARKNYGFKIYPDYLENPADVFRCKISPEIPVDFIFSGYHKAGDIVNLNFVEYLKIAKVVMDDDTFVV